MSAGPALPVPWNSIGPALTVLRRPPPLFEEFYRRSGSRISSDPHNHPPDVNPCAPGSDTVLCEDIAMMMTLTVLATLIAVPFLFGVLLAAALGGFIVLHFAADRVRALRCATAAMNPGRMDPE